MTLSVQSVAAQRAQLWDAGFRPIAIYNIDHPNPEQAGKAPIGFEWEKRARSDPPEAVTFPPVRHALNTGILCDGLRAIDIDIDDAELAHAVKSEALSRFGETMIRWRRNSPRCLLVYRAAEGQPPKAVIAGVHGKVEVLGKGQQFVAFGLHPTGAVLEWLPEAPGEASFDSSPAITEEELRDFLTAMAPLIGAAPPVVSNGKDHHPAREAQAEPFRVAGWLASIPNDGPKDWEWWNRVGMATWAATAGSSMGGEMFNEWSKRNSSYNLEATEERWRHYQRSPPTQIGAGTLAFLAKGAEAPPPPDYPPESIPNDVPDHEPSDDVSDTPRSAFPTIQIVDGELHELASRGEDAMLRTGMPLFQRGRELVRPVHQEVPASKGRITVSAGLTRITTHGMVDLLCQSAYWTRWDARKKIFTKTNATERIANIILSRVGLWSAPTVAGVITTPTLRPDGTVLHQPGYDGITRLYQVVDPSLKPAYIPPEPSRHDADKALEVLNGLIDEFPFVADVDRAVALSALITPIVRGAISVAPLHAIKASTAGTGKSYLADLASAIATGRPCPVISVSPDPKETEARLTGLLLAGFPLISLDNVNGELGGDLLCQAVERPTVRLRRLGGSDIFEIESRATFFATGNGLRVRGDMTRRTVICNLDAGVERPESREFNHSPVDDVLADRGKYVAAAMTIVRAYIVAGCPQKLRSLASFEEWSDRVRSALVWLGLPDPVDTTEAARDDDPELTALRDVLQTWKSAVGDGQKTVRGAIEIAMSRNLTFMGEVTDLKFPDFQEALLSVSGFKGSIDSKRLGNWLRAREGRIVDGLRFKKGTHDAHSKVATWIVS